jgi:hypothetical protein
MREIIFAKAPSPSGAGDGGEPYVGDNVAHMQRGAMREKHLPGLRRGAPPSRLHFYDNPAHAARTRTHPWEKL